MTSDIGLYNVASNIIRNEQTPPGMSVDDVLIEPVSETIQFETTFTDSNGTNSPTKNGRDAIESSEGYDFRDDEYRDEDFRDDELDFLYGDIDDIEDDSDKMTIKKEPIDMATHSTVDDGPSCPFCNFSFKGLSENVHYLIRSR